MILKCIDENVYREFLRDREYKFLQSFEQIQYCKKNNREYYILALFDGSEIIKANLVIAMPFARFFKKAYINMYSFGEGNNLEIDRKFILEAKRFLAKKKVVKLYVTTAENINNRDSESNIIEITQTQKELDTFMKNIGFVDSDRDDVVIYSYQYVKNLENIRDEEELIMSYKTKDRNKIRKSFKNGLMVEKLTRDKLDLFRELFNKSAVKQGFSKQKISYFQSYFDAYDGSDKLDFLYCYLDVEKYLDIRTNELEDLSKKIENAKNKQEAEKKYLELEKKINVIRNMSDSTKYIPLSCGIFIQSKDEYVYFIGGNDDEYSKYLGSYYLQHSAMKIALEKNLKKYNFFGTIGAYDIGSDNDRGVYIFKRRFNGYPEQLGSYMVDIGGLKSFMANFIQKLSNRKNSK